MELGRLHEDSHLASREICWPALQVGGASLMAQLSMATLSKTQIDRLGDRLRKGSPSEADLRLLDEYRRSFGEAYETVIRAIREQLRLEPTGRAAKSTSSIIEKLRRESIRLSQVQDIAGCRVIVEDIATQNRIVASLQKKFPKSSIVDRRDKPSFGYRAVHVIPLVSGKLVEIQVRTFLQHLWAELSEKLADILDPAIKYGGGSDPIQKVLLYSSESVEVMENYERDYAQRSPSSIETYRRHRQEFSKAFQNVISALLEENET